MKNSNIITRKTAIRNSSIIVFALCLLISFNVIAKTVTAQTSPHVEYNNTIPNDNIGVTTENVVLIDDCTLPDGWAGADIGVVSGQSSCESGGIFTILGGGTDIWGTSDQFRYTYKSLNGDGTIVAKVWSIQNTDGWAKSGVMIRESLAAGSKHVSLFVTPAAGTAYQIRSTTGGATTNSGGSGTAPYWVKLQRAGNVFSAYSSPDGATWTQIGSSTTVTMATNVYIGLALTSHAIGKLCTSTFSDVSVSDVVVSIAITSGSNPILPGSSITFTSTPTKGGTTPSYQWKVDGVDVGIDSPVFTTSALTNGQIISCVMTSDSNEVVTSNSITMFVYSPSSVVNILDMGATPNDGTDDTQAIQAAVDLIGGTSGTVTVPSGTFNIDVSIGVSLGNNMTLSMSSEAILKALPTSLGNYKVIEITNKSNVNITGGTIAGERHVHLGPGDHINCPGCAAGEWGMGIWITSSSAVYLDGVTVRECWGDGYYVDGGSTNINMNNCVADDNRRQGMSLIHVDGMVVTNCVFKNTEGTAPQSGIDMEPDFFPVKNIQILNCQFIDNHGAGAMTFSQDTWVQPFPEVSNITFTGNTISGSRWGWASVNAYSGITFSNNTIIGATIQPIFISGSTNVNNIYSNNTISISPTLGGDIAAITIQNGAKGNTFTNNCISGYFYGIKDDVGGNTISGSCPTDPVLSVDASSLSFGTFPKDSISPEQSYTLTGSNLSYNVTVTAASGYLISTTSGAGFKAQLTITPTSGSVNQTIYVRFEPRKAKVYNGSIYNSSAGDIKSNVAVTGICTDPTGIDATTKTENVIVSPNPFHTNFRIKMPSRLTLKNARIKIYDLTGKEVNTVLISQNETTISRKGMENGIYFYSIFNNNNRITDGKLIVQ